jgi:hypothetical protein
MSEIFTQSPKSFVGLDKFIQDTTIFESFVLTLFYREISSCYNTLIQEKLFLFVEDFVEVARSLNTSDTHAQKEILLSMRIDKEKLDVFFLELSRQGMYGYPFFRKQEIQEFCTEIVDNSLVSSMKLCNNNFDYFLRQEFMNKEGSMSGEDKVSIQKNMYNNLKFTTIIREKLQEIAG